MANGNGSITIEFKVDGKAVGILVPEEKEFRTGSKGYFAQGKVAVGGKRYQVSCNLVEIGSKPKP